MLKILTFSELAVGVGIFKHFFDNMLPTVKNFGIVLYKLFAWQNTSLLLSVTQF